MNEMLLLSLLVFLAGFELAVIGLGLEILQDMQIFLGLCYIVVSGFMFGLSINEIYKKEEK